MSDLFSVLGLPPKLLIDLPTLNEQFRKLSLESHPDRDTSGSPEARAMAIKKSSRLNEAYRVLKDPWTRATYAVDLHSQSTTLDSPPESMLAELMEIQEATMELQETLMEDDDQKAQTLKNQLKSEQARLIKDREALDQRRDTLFSEIDSGNESAYSRLSSLLGERKYLNRILQTIEAAIS